MRISTVRLAAMAMALLVGGCVSWDSANWDVDGVAAMAPKGDAFTQALHKHYVERAAEEVSDYDWVNVRAFLERARAAAAGVAVKPSAPAERGLGGNPEVADTYAKLTARLATTAPKDNPEACALAQTWYEQWLEDLEEGHQRDEIAEAKGGFEEAIAGCIPAAEEPPKHVAKNFTIYFDFNKAVLTAQGRMVIEEVAKAQAELKPANIFIAGHTDTKGGAALNQTLSEKRAKVVADALAKKGVKAEIMDIKAHGKNRPAVATGDNVKEPLNRRVEIHFEK
ncbi:MAG: OmpA family protein [Solirubrobacterales bacterium]